MGIRHRYRAWATWLRGTHVALSVLTLAACGAGEPAPAVAGLTTTIDTIGGIVFVRSRGAAPEWAAEPVLEIGRPGGVGEAAPDEFGRIRSIVADGAGNLYVADQTAAEIRVFDAAGRFRTVIGRRGGGPGEIGDLYSLAWIGDTLAVLDPAHARIGLFAPDGSWVGSWPHQPVTGDARVRFYPVGPERTYAFGVRVEEDRVAALYIGFGAAGAADTLRAPRAERSAGILCTQPDDGIAFFDVPFEPRLIHAPAPGGGLAVAWTGDYRIAFVDAAGDTARVVERSWEPVPVSGEEWNEALADYRAYRERVAGAHCTPGTPARPGSKPAIRDFFFDTAGRLWVEAWTRDGFVFDIFDAAGRWIGTLPAPPRQEQVVPFVRGEMLYLVAADAFDVQRVRAFRISEETTASPSAPGP